MQENDNNAPDIEQGINMKDLLWMCISRWYWFVLSLFICCGFAFYQILKTPKVYQRNALLMIKDDRLGGTAGGDVGASFSGMGFLQANTNISNEIISITSPTVMYEVVKRLGLNVSYTVPGMFYPEQLYGTNLPVTLKFPDVEDGQNVSLKATLYPDGKMVMSDFNLGKKDAEGKFYVTGDDRSLGSVSTFFGNFGVMMKAYAYILTLGRNNIRNVGPMATLNANYIKESLKDAYKLPIEGPCKHEFVFDGLLDKSTGVTTLNVAKRLLDYGFHAPTIYFPLLFHESMMIEPTETESKETLDEFIDVMHRVAREAAEDPEMVKRAPVTAISHPDETGAAKNPILSYRSLKKAKA